MTEAIVTCTRCKKAWTYETFIADHSQNGPHAEVAWSMAQRGLAGCNACPSTVLSRARPKHT